MSTKHKDDRGTSRLKVYVEIDREIYTILRDVSKSCGLNMSGYIRSLLYTHLASRRDNTETNNR
ncbi:hypothetical protein [Methylobacterium symbioticum]|uniref:Ribbon-helix-helix protein CopG domain-containing protein n=1 Tax=Methylobacterium symbioticum TaxID=2584084 RepID=A0A509E723_9HYPH|nr:hypothetical protein [Methylobacterium symbioticum]VUD70027.1 hypothetical protein MET9862_00588 [Methylobacterium symbioticum]